MSPGRAEPAPALHPEAECHELSKPRTGNIAQRENTREIVMGEWEMQVTFHHACCRFRGQSRRLLECTQCAIVNTTLHSARPNYGFHWISRSRIAKRLSQPQPGSGSKLT